MKTKISIFAGIICVAFICSAWQVTNVTVFDNLVVRTNMTLGGVARNTWPSGGSSVGTGLQAGDGAGGFEAADVTDVNAAVAGGTVVLTNSVSGSGAESTLELRPNWNTSGNPSALKIVVDDDASGAAAKPIEVLGGATGTTELFSVSKAGSTVVTPTGSAQNTLRVNHSDGTARVQAGIYPTSSPYAGFWFGNVTPATTNYGLIGNGSSDLIFNVTSGAIRFRNGHTTNVFNLNPSGASVGASSYYGFTSTAGDASGTVDLYLHRDDPNTLQVGVDAATVADQNVKAADGSGTDKVGADLNLKGGRSTGTGAGGALVLSTSQSSTTGSSLNAYTERFHAIPKFVNLTDETAVTILTGPVAAASYLGFTATITVFASDGTDHQSKTSVVTVDAVAKTTTITPTVSQVDNSTAASAGTLTCTYTVVDNGSNVLALKATADTSLTATTLRCKIVLTAINSNGTAAFTEQ